MALRPLFRPHPSEVIGDLSQVRNMLLAVSTEMGVWPALADFEAIPEVVGLFKRGYCELFPL